MKKRILLVPDDDLENQKKFEEILESSCPELFYIFKALDQTEIEPSLVIEFVYQLRNIIDSGWGRVWVDVVEHEPTFIHAEKKLKLKEE